MKTVHVLVGLPATGKTHLRKNLQKQYPSAAVFSTDDYIMQVAQDSNHTYEQVFSENIGRAIQQADITLRYAIKYDRNIIWDKTNTTPDERRGIIRRMKGAGYRTVAHVIRAPETPKEKQEWQHRLQNSQEKHSDKKVLNRIAETYQYPSEAENWDQIHYYDMWGEPCVV